MKGKIDKVDASLAMLGATVAFVLAAIYCIYIFFYNIHVKTETSLIQLEQKYEEAIILAQQYRTMLDDKIEAIKYNQIQISEQNGNHQADIAALKKIIKYQEHLLKTKAASKPVSTIPDFKHISETGLKERGIASWYGAELHGNKTASGERFDMHAMTAAHKRLPFGSVVKVTNRKNGKSVMVTINDRGPFIHGRIIDLSKAAAAEIGMLNAPAPVTVELASK